MLGLVGVVSVHVLQMRNFLPKAEEVVRKIGHFVDDTLFAVAASGEHSLHLCRSTVHKLPARRNMAVSIIEESMVRFAAAAIKLPNTNVQP